MNMNPSALLKHSRFVANLLAIVALIGGCQLHAAEPKAIFIIVDGIPADVVESVTTPAIDAIAGDQGYTRAYVGGAVGQASESPTVSAVGYNSLLTGTWSNKHNVWDNDVNEPNYDYWDIFRIAKAHNQMLTTGLFSTWTDNRTKLIGNGLAEAGGDKLDYYSDGFELDTDRFPHDLASNYIREIDNVVAAETARHIEEFGPHLSWVYLQYTDDIGHRYGDSPEQAAALQLADEQVGLIWNAVQRRRESHDEDWLVIVTTDHGRDPDTGRGHGAQSDRERTTWIATNSDRLNDHFRDTPGIVDILPSVASHLELGIPEKIRNQLDGRSFID